MTAAHADEFDAAFDQAAGVAKEETVEGHPKTWLQRLRLRARPRFRPTPTERREALEACRRACRHTWESVGELPTQAELIAAAKSEVGIGTLTILWVVAMVTRLLINLRELLVVNDA